MLAKYTNFRGQGCDLRPPCDLLALIVIEISNSWHVKSAITLIKLYYKTINKRSIMSSVNEGFKVAKIQSLKVYISRLKENLLKVQKNQADYVLACSDIKQSSFKSNEK